MTNAIYLDDASQYATVVERVARNGRRRTSRGLTTRDLGHTTIILQDTYKAMPLGCGRGLDPAIGAVEAIQLIAGTSDPGLVLKVAPQFERYMDSISHSNSSVVKHFHGAYGDRVNGQIQCAINKIHADPGTRQAVVTLWDPWLDNLTGKNDYPCTVALLFSINHDGHLELDVLMRSNDVWLGLPYDMFQFTQLQRTIARSLNIETGQYRHTAWSLHLYESNFDVAAQFINYAGSRTYNSLFQPRAIGRAEMSFDEIRMRAHAIMNNAMLDSETGSEMWYRRQLHGESKS